MQGSRKQVLEQVPQSTLGCLVFWGPGLPVCGRFCELPVGDTT